MTTMPRVGDVVPHSGRMRLLDRIVSYGENTLTAEWTIAAEHPFVRDGHVGAWIGIEYMAQAIAAFAGCDGYARGEPPKVGFLVGTRLFTSSAPNLPLGELLTVSVVRHFNDESGLGSFHASITSANFNANATLSVFQPDNVEQYLRDRHA
jgi:predicted hotdog family 3-hydroxylacyl-ACP dehydratase